MSNQIIILAAGKGTRMGQGDLPKVLVPFLDKPMIAHLLTEVSKIPLEHKPIVVVGYKYDLVQKALGDNYVYAFQQGQLGTAHAVAAARKHSTAENALVLYGDMPFIKAESLDLLNREHQNNQNTITMFTTTLPNFEGICSVFNGYGRILRDDDGNIKAIKEYADATEQERNILEVNPGIYLFNADWLWKNIDLVQPKNQKGEYYLTDIVGIANNKRMKIKAVPINHQEVYGINTPEHLRQAEQMLKELI